MRPKAPLPLIALAIFMVTALVPPRARAERNTPTLDKIDKIHEMRRETEYRYRDRIRQIDANLKSERMTEIEAIQAKRLNEQEYQSRLERLKDDELHVLHSGKRSQRKSGTSAAPTNPALPRIRSQSVVTYPGADGESTEEKSAAEGRQKNVGFGTRELEF